MAVRGGTFISVDEVEGFVFTVNVVGFDGTFPEDPEGDGEDGDEEGAVEASEEEFGGENVFAQGDGNGFWTGRELAAVNGRASDWARVRRMLFSETKACGCECTGFK